MKYTKPVVKVYKDMIAANAKCHSSNYCAGGAGPAIASSLEC